jgi:hypothetical protein
LYDSFPDIVKVVLMAEKVHFYRPSKVDPKKLNGWKRRDEVLRIIDSYDIDHATRDNVSDYVCWALGI